MRAPLLVAKGIEGSSVVLGEQRGNQRRAFTDIVAEAGRREIAGDGGLVGLQPFGDRRHRIGRAGREQEEIGERRAFRLPAAETTFLLGGEASDCLLYTSRCV